MVSTAVKVEEAGASAVAAASVGNVNPPEGLPAGNYTLVGWDMDTTGRRLIDEICQIGAFTPSLQFSQYIMPHGNLNPGARRRHNIRVVTIGRYRMLKDNSTNKVLKTKSEISALTEFLEWLEAQKGESSDGVILIFHEPRKVTSPMLLEALRKYQLTDRFKKVVAGFADGQALATDKCRATVKSFGLRVMTKVLLDTECTLDSAVERASAAYKVAQHLSQGEQQDLVVKPEAVTDAAQKSMCEMVRGYARSTEKELADLIQLKSLLDRQNTFRPVFGPLLVRTSREERLRAATLRRILAEGGFNYEQLKDLWATGKSEGLAEELKDLPLTKEQSTELIEILDCHYDPAKESKGPKPRAPRIKNVKNGVGNKSANGEEESAGGVPPASGVSGVLSQEQSGTTTPDTTSSGSPVKVKPATIDSKAVPNNTNATRSTVPVVNDPKC